MRQVKLILLIFATVVVIILIVQNMAAISGTVQFRVNPLISHEIRTPPIAIGLVTLIAFFLGLVVAGVCGIMERFRLKKRIKQYEKELQIKNQELNSLRNLPITSDDVNSGPVNQV
ncbi:MAG: LapA family protein [Deltaproteobacteria bacterium]|nr:LapA family protein [Deltaproteobacteria bacterium]MBW2128438.1 LapA family protein [Deltaproteobacteria bacterium]